MHRCSTETQAEGPKN